jgi:hypothetical protein
MNSGPGRLSRLAAAIDRVNRQDRVLLTEIARVEQLRIQGAAALHGICGAFVDDLNARLAEPSLQFDPPVFDPGRFRDSAPNLFQINLSGRLLQIEFTATDELVSTDDFRKPYTLVGTVRSFNRELLAQNSVDEQSIYFCPEGASGEWHYFDSRTYRTGRVSGDFLARELERLL